MWSLHYGVKQSDNSIEDFVHGYSLPWELETISILRPYKISGAQCENVFLFVQIYSIYTDFYWQTTTNQIQLNIPNDSKTFMGKTIHTLSV